MNHNRPISLLVTVILFISVAFTTTGQSGQIDLSFNPIDVGGGLGANFFVNACAVQPDAKIIIAGDFQSYNMVGRNRVARLNVDGTLDETFNPGMGSNLDEEEINVVLLQPDGKILLAGRFTQFNGAVHNRIVRLNPDGSVDNTFNTGTGANQMIRALALRPDGKIYIGGDFNNYNGNQINRLARLNEDGSFDPTFNPGAGVAAPVHALLQQPDGRLVVGGEFNFANSVAYNRIVRFNPDGNLDPTFSVGTGFNSQVRSLAIQTDGKILVGGGFTQYNGENRNRIARLNEDGTLDTEFNPGTGIGNQPGNWIYSILVLPSGKIVIGGEFSVYDGTPRFNITGVNEDGSLNTDMEVGTGAGFDVKGLANYPGNRIVVCGWFVTYNEQQVNYIHRVYDNGESDPFFDPVNGADLGINAILTDQDGRIYIGGNFSFYNAVSRRRVARLEPNGLIDPTWDPGTACDATVHSLILQPDGKLVIAGSFTQVNGVPRNRIARLNNDGSVDMSFNPGTGADISIRTMALLPDGKIVIGGDFQMYNGQFRNRVARINSDGSLDAAFHPGQGPDLAVLSLAVQSDGKVLIGGSFTSVAGQPRNRVARLLPDGGLDATFDVGSGANNTVRVLRLNSDGKVSICGNFTQYNSVGRTRLARLNTDGSLDTSFDPGTGANVEVFSMIVLAAGKAIIGGSFQSYNGSPSVRLARVNADGSFDSDFQVGSGANNTVTGMAIQPDGKIIVGGNFTEFQDVPKNRLTRVEGGCVPFFDTIEDSSCGPLTLNGETFTQSGQYYQFLSSANGCDSTLLLNLTISVFPDINVINQEGNSFVAAPGGESYQWLDCESTLSPIPGANSEILFSEEPGIFAVEVTVGECSFVSDCFVFTPIGINENELGSLSAFPNPASESIRLILPFAGGSLMVSDAMGRTVHFTETVSDPSILLPVSDWAAGMYQVNYLIENSILTLQFAVQK